MPPDDDTPPLRGAALANARRELAARNKDVTMRWCLEEARMFLERRPPAIFEAITHIDAAIAIDIKARRRHAAR